MTHSSIKRLKNLPDYIPLPEEHYSNLNKEFEKKKTTTKCSKDFNRNNLKSEITHITHKFSFLYEKASNTDL